MAHMSECIFSGTSQSGLVLSMSAFGSGGHVGFNPKRLYLRITISKIAADNIFFCFILIMF